jgi:hypothetical protein
MNITQTGCGCAPQRTIPRNPCEPRTVAKFEPCNDYDTVCPVEMRCGGTELGKSNNYGFDFYTRKGRTMDQNTLFSATNSGYYNMCSNC